MINRRTFLGISALTLLFKDLTLLHANDFPTRQSPVIINKQAKLLLIYTELNLKSAFKDNPHWGIVARNGKLQNKAILKAFVDAIDFHDALIGIGAKAGNNLTEEKTGCITCLESCWIAITAMRDIQTSVISKGHFHQT
ncbi:MAG: hypothetical protein N3A59_00915 [Thermodesulfovibrionales bacterium]|nr:hypothetical protein [Thermodesulfovibrionales bacterium]